MSDILVRAQELSGRWVSIGSDAARGIVAQNVVADSDAAGCRSCSFVLRRPINVPWPDIGPLAPLEIFDQGGLVWSGRVKGTPTSDGSDRSITVNGEGWQYHLDDDVYQKTYVHSKLSDFVDSKSLLGCPLANWNTAGQVTVGDGAIVLSFPGDGSGSPVIPANSFVGVTLDFGQVGCTDVAVNWQNSNNAAPILFYCRGSDNPDGGVAGDDAFAFAVGAPNPAAAFNTGSFATPRRYVNLFMFWAAGGALAADVWVKIIPPTSFFSSSAYVVAGNSVLKASDIVLDAETRATLLLSPDTSKIQATSFSIPEFAMSALQTPREVIVAANAFEAWQYRVGPDLLLDYRPLPAVPLIQVDQRSQFNEVSSGDTSEIYSGALVSYTDAAGAAQTVARSQPATVYAIASLQPSNPGAEVNTTGWAAGGGGTLSRTTTGGEFTTGVAGFKVNGSLADSASSSGWTAGAWIPGTSYRLLLDIRGAAGSTLGASITVDGATVGTVSTLGTGAFATGLALDWVQPSASTPVIYVTGYLPSGLPWNYYFDNLVLYESAATIVNRRGFRRTKVLDTQMALTTEAAQKVADVYLLNHKNTPLKGQLVITGYGLASNARSGQRMRPSELLLHPGEIARLMHLIDPDTGALGREGRIASASWDSDSNTVTIEIDSQSTNFEALVQRLAVLTSQVH